MIFLDTPKNRTLKSFAILGYEFGFMFLCLCGVLCCCSDTTHSIGAGSHDNVTNASMGWWGGGLYAPSLRACIEMIRYYIDLWEILISFEDWRVCQYFYLGRIKSTSIHGVSSQQSDQCYIPSAKSLCSISSRNHYWNMTILVLLFTVICKFWA